MSRPRLLLVRHGESTWNAAARWQGWGDPPLSEAGRAQARGLVAQLAGISVARLVSSDLARAAETAAILAPGLGLVPEFDTRLRERDLGRWSGLTEPEIRAAHPEEMGRFLARDPSLEPGGGESRAAFFARVAPAIASLADAARAGTLLVVTHFGVIRLLAPERHPGNAEALTLDPEALLASLA